MLALCDLTYSEKQLLLYAINSRIEHLRFAIENSKYYSMEDYLIEVFKQDIEGLVNLREKIFLIEIK